MKMIQKSNTRISGRSWASAKCRCKFGSWSYWSLSWSKSKGYSLFKKPGLDTTQYRFNTDTPLPYRM